MAKMFSGENGAPLTSCSLIMKRTCVVTFVFSFLCSFCFAAGTIRVATYNVENYLDQPTEMRHFVKSAEAKAKIRESIKAMNPDVLALEEMGTTNALLELRTALKADGIDFPFWDYVEGADTNIHVAVLSKFPIVARHPHTNDEFLLDGRRFRVERGFAEVEIEAATNFNFTLIAAHLKSQLQIPIADQAEERLGEAKVLRGIIDAHFKTNLNARLIVLGDFNDSKNSDPIKTIIGRGKFKLADTRPAEHNGDNEFAENIFHEPRDVTWTYFFGADDTYSRIDYIFISPAMARNWMTSETYAVTIPNWGIGSDHRPIVATFNAENN
jgi:endonuclease/exonuclease/phosphatase family metal-dependent hydrolase